MVDIHPENHDVGGNASLDNLLSIVGEVGDTLHLSKADGWGAADSATLSGYAIYVSQGVQIAVDKDIVVSVT